jgi:hypothetical protein
MPLQPKVIGHLLLGIGLQELFQYLSRPPLQVAPKTHASNRALDSFVNTQRNGRN